MQQVKIYVSADIAQTLNERTEEYIGRHSANWSDFAKFVTRLGFDPDEFSADALLDDDDDSFEDWNAHVEAIHDTFSYEQLIIDVRNTILRDALDSPRSQPSLIAR